jgi:hypothetical protein
VLARIARRVDGEATNCWLLVGITALVGWGAGASMLFLSPLALLMGGPYLLADSADESVLLQGLGYVAAFSLTLVIPAGIVVAAIYLYRQRYRTVAADLVWGSMGLTLIDESFGEHVEALRQTRYRPLLGVIHLGSDLGSRLNHFAYYYQHYFALSRGPGEPIVAAPAPLNCWIDGGLMFLCAGNCILLYVLLGLRILLTYPRIVATKRAALDFLGGKWDAALEQQYAPRR